MKILLFLCLCLPVVSQAATWEYGTYQSYVDQVKNDAKMKRLAIRTDAVLKTIIEHAAAKLEEEGFTEESQRILMQYRGAYEGYLMRHTQGDYKVGDFAPLLSWIDTWYKKVEFILGKSACRMLHISDLYALNHEIPVVFDPCNKNRTILDFKEHFAGDDNYDGLFPILVYWTTFVGCEVGSGGVGTIAWFCGIFGSAGEYLAATFVAPGLANTIWLAACN